MLTTHSLKLQTWLKSNFQTSHSQKNFQVAKKQNARCFNQIHKKFWIYQNAWKHACKPQFWVVFLSILTNFSSFCDNFTPIKTNLIQSFTILQPFFLAILDHFQLFNLFSWSVKVQKCKVTFKTKRFFIDRKVHLDTF